MSSLGNCGRDGGPAVSAQCSGWKPLSGGMSRKAHQVFKQLGCQHIFVVGGTPGLEHLGRPPQNTCPVRELDVPCRFIGARPGLGEACDACSCESPLHMHSITDETSESDNKISDAKHGISQDGVSLR